MSAGQIEEQIITGCCGPKNAAIRDVAATSQQPCTNRVTDSGKHASRLTSNISLPLTLWGSYLQNPASPLFKFKC